MPVISRLPTSNSNNSLKFPINEDSRILIWNWSESSRCNLALIRERDPPCSVRRRVAHDYNSQSIPKNCQMLTDSAVEGNQAIKTKFDGGQVKTSKCEMGGRGKNFPSAVLVL